VSAAQPRRPVLAYVALGANLGQARQAVQAAFMALSGQPGVCLQRCSSLYRTAPIDSQGPDYINAVAQIQTTLGAMELLHCLQAIEADAGRERPYRNAPRTLDLDLLLYGQSRIMAPSLQVPHPRMLQRAFVLEPLAEIAPEAVLLSLRLQLAEQRIERLSEA
jgi:2-amino-4-hydroxy-6-hydroxymethyldihydropteridine diphosphokinase